MLLNGAMIHPGSALACTGWNPNLTRALSSMSLRRRWQFCLFTQLFSELKEEDSIRYIKIWWMASVDGKYSTRPNSHSVRTSCPKSCAHSGSLSPVRSPGSCAFISMCIPPSCVLALDQLEFEKSLLGCFPESFFLLVSDTGPCYLLGSAWN